MQRTTRRSSRHVGRVDVEYRGRAAFERDRIETATGGVAEPVERATGRCGTRSAAHEVGVVRSGAPGGDARIDDATAGSARERRRR